MKAKSMILIMIALGCGTVAAVGISQVIVADDGEEKVATAKILVAMKLIDIAEPLDGENVKLEEWPSELVPEGALMSMEDVDNLIPKLRIVKGQAIMQDMLVDEKEGAQLKIPDGYRVTSMKVSVDEALAGLLQPGDRVDITWFVKRNEEQIAKTFLQDMQVYAINEKTDRIIDPDGKTLMAKTVSMLVTPDQVRRLLLAKRSGYLHLSLRSHTDDEEDKDNELTLSEILDDDFGKGRKTNRPSLEDKEEDASFKSWLDGMRGGGGQPFAQVPGVGLTNPDVMTVHTNEGITQYTWHDPKGLPEVSELGFGGAISTAPAAMAPPVPPTPAGGSGMGTGAGDGGQGNDQQARGNDQAAQGSDQNDADNGDE